ncbi:hypothetical protein [Tautonia sociabilis]|uniref:Uncharacterized protein n=1 Tax=Tautonia sociabilis TaxID=2080755 RepID=A0A432MHQ8_9BACT|nr:hypothetical protein [Tautonia sociabilis]RUL86459.1 hypothetical protein TsocGM_15925 [Tautonia sociabilis]
MDDFDPSEFDTAPGEPAETGAATPVVDSDLAPGPVLRRWERWWVLDNAILLGVTVLTALLDLGRTLGDPEFYGFAIVGAVLANVCFTAGPIAEAYLYWIGIRGRAVGLVLMAVGTLASMLLTFGCVIAYLEPTFGPN